MAPASHPFHSLTPGEVRRRIRAKQLDAPTTGMADGYVQANLVILPKTDAERFLGYCGANQRPPPRPAA